MKTINSKVTWIFIKNKMWYVQLRKDIEQKRECCCWERWKTNGIFGKRCTRAAL